MINWKMISKFCWLSVKKNVLKKGAREEETFQFPIVQYSIVKRGRP